MPQVHARAVEQVGQGPEPDVDVGVVELAPEGREHDGGEQGLGVATQPEQGDVEQALVDHDFDPVETEVGQPVHALHGVVQLVELPQRGNPVQEPVHVPLQEVADDQVDEQLQPERAAVQQALVGEQ